MAKTHQSRRGSSPRNYALELSFAAQARRMPASERRGILDRLRRHGKPSNRGPGRLPTRRSGRAFYELDPCTGRWKRL